jgi:signal transduction histidine kinase/CheY-like chemotaxis protein
MGAPAVHAATELDTFDAGTLLRVLSQARAGDFTARMPVDWTGLDGKIADGLNEILSANEAFATELQRVSRIVGKEGRLSQRASFNGADRVWADSIESVNTLIDDLVRPSNEMQRVIGAVADGDLSNKVSVDVQGEMLELKNTINGMVDQLNGFVSEVTRVAREVGTEGTLGGQAQSREVAGVWNETIRNLRETSRRNTEQDWLKTNLERFTRRMQGHRDLATVSNLILSELAPLVSAQHGAFYVLVDDGPEGRPVLRFQGGYGFKERKNLASVFQLGEGLVGQCALEKTRILLTQVPADYITINSGLGEAPPLNIIVLPILFEGSVRAVIELASFSAFSATHQSFLEQLAESIGLLLNTVSATTVTERLLVEAQSEVEELRSRQEQLHQSNEDLARQATLLADQNSEIASKYQEVEEAKRLVEEKATELSVSSKYKSEFIANMSHELRTPLNSLLVLAEQLEDNPDGNLTPRQVQYATVILTSGRDLLNLLNDILDLAKVESQTVHFELDDVLLTDLRDSLEQSFRPVADLQDLQFSVVLDDALPASLVTDRHRLRQVVTNLLSNAFKFTEQGEVSLRLSLATRGWRHDHERLARAASVLAIDVQDTGIGIKADLHAAIFEAFAQADGSTSRTYGGTGLGLSISRNLVNLLGGEITVASDLGRGSTFTVYLPLDASMPAGTVPTAGARSSVGVTSAAAPAYALRNGGALSEFISGVWTSEAFYNGAVSGTKVLIVDDDFRNIFALTALLERGGLEVIAAETGMSAMDSLREHPDISMVLMDIMMPEMDGYETMAAIRSHPAWAGLPMIAVTGKAEASERDRCLSAGASDYIPKPVDTAELLEALHQWFPVAATARAGPALRRDSSV